jgi:hypothetical protein
MLGVNNIRRKLMGKHILFLLKPGFKETEGGPYYCPDSAAIEGFLKYGPEIEKQIEVRRIEFPKPRKEIIELVGEANQGCPVLVLDESSELPDEATISEETGRANISDATKICDFLGRLFGVARPHP